MYLASQRLVFLSTSQRRFSLFIPLHLVVLTIFFRHVASLVATCQSVDRKRLPWSHNLRSERLTAKTPPYATICVRPERVIRGPTSHGIWSRTSLRQGSSHPANNYTGLTSSVSVFWTTVALKISSSPNKKVSFKIKLLLLLIHSVLLASSVLVLRASQSEGSFLVSLSSCKHSEMN